MIPVILSGGSGSRLWPVSRESYPKQFCELFDESFLLNTYNRVAHFGQPYVVTLESMGGLTERGLRAVSFQKDHLILEPMSKNTAPALGLFLHKAGGLLEDDDVIGVFPADHVIGRAEVFEEAVRLAQLEAQKGAVVTLGVNPTYASTGYGYIEISDAVQVRMKNLAAQVVSRFIEKPKAEVAEEFLTTGRHFWNAGIFFFSVKTLRQLFQLYMPDLMSRLSTVKADFSNLKYVYANLQSQSIDFGIMEKAQNIRCIPADYGWSDVGSWDGISRISEEAQGLKVDSKASVFNEGAEDNFVFSNHGKVVGLIDVHDLIVVDTPDALLVTRKGHSQTVKKLVDGIRQAKIPEATEHLFEVRPWGKFEVLSDTPTHKVKRLTIDPGGRLSYQMHQKREENWVVVSGRAEVLMENKAYLLSPGQAFFAPRGHKHRISNAGPEPLVIVEVQTGSYFGEDDIERFQDDYNRI